MYYKNNIFISNTNYLPIHFKALLLYNELQHFAQHYYLSVSQSQPLCLSAFALVSLATAAQRPRSSWGRRQALCVCRGRRRPGTG